MFDNLSVSGWLKLAGGLLAIRVEHGEDIATLKRDVPKALSLAKDVAALVNKVHAEEPTAKPHVIKDADAPMSRPSGRTAEQMTAYAAIQHVEQHGISEAEQRAFDRASQQTG